MRSELPNTAKRVSRLLATTVAAVCAWGASIDANAQLTLNAAGIADGFSLSSFYTDPGANYGLIGAVSAPGGVAIGSGFARGQLYRFSDVDGQSFGTANKTVSAGGTPTGIASVNGQVYVGLLGGHYYSVDPTTLALTQVAPQEQSMPTTRSGPTRRTAT